MFSIYNNYHICLLFIEADAHRGTNNSESTRKITLLFFALDIITQRLETCILCVAPLLSMKVTSPKDITKISPPE